METIEEAIVSYLNGNWNHVKTWRVENRISLSSMLNIYLLDYNPNKIEIVHFITRLEN